MHPTLSRPAAASPAGTAFDDQLAARLLHERIVVLGQEVDDAVANRVCAQLLLLAAEDDRRDISLYVNSPGGSVYAGMAIYDTMRFVPNDVATLGLGFAASMGQFLLCAGAPGKRYSLPHTRIMMHQPSGGMGGTAADIAIQAQNLAHTKRLMLELTARHTGQSVETVERDSRRDRWFTAEQARDYGMVDHVVEHASALRTPSTRGYGFLDGRGATGEGRRT
ncbi:ATP-dependent Clp protease proteolytic subunit [Thermobifida halotolerans]|uniref:ATP-dependent Clp protease proteolytic subunit n=1 Tax=Thermobifida halotolerans TaxID=483545 RepID=A0AA97LZS6_9ACTN|nr:ATP-dependent Clp protease proteolytic subunit [Thermobifida halotolerans]UOE20805.1 ATP-dependent Clp protease proteolytic subunit [Thermobifida halotolerans]